MDEKHGLCSSDMNGNVFDKFGHIIDPKIPGGTRFEAIRRVMEASNKGATSSGPQNVG
jgi:hypothetical protein